MIDLPQILVPHVKLGFRHFLFLQALLSLSQAPLWFSRENRKEVLFAYRLRYLFPAYSLIYHKELYFLKEFL